MKRVTRQALTSYWDSIPDVMARFVFDNHSVFNRDGLIITPQGFARPFYHKPTNTVGLLFSKTANNLRGAKRQDGKIYSTSKEMERCYIIAARRCKGDRDEPLNERDDDQNNRKSLRRSLEGFCEEFGERNLKHFTGFMAGNTFSNGQMSYEIIKRWSGKYDVVLRLPTRRKDGSFIPFDLTGPKTLRGHFAKASLTVARADTYAKAQKALFQHWNVLSSELWDEKNVFNGKGVSLKGKKLLADFVNTSCDHALTFSAATVFVGGATAMITPGLGLLGGMFGAVAHTAGHVFAERVTEGAVETRHKVEKARNKPDIEDYRYNTDVSDYFKIQDEENIGKTCPHMDLERFRPEEFELLDIDQFSLLKDREQPQSNLQDTSIAGHLLFMHQRGFSSTCHILDGRTEIRMFQSGIVRLIHERKDGKIIVFGQYRPDLCVDDGVRLPQSYIDQFKGGIVRVEYDRTKSTFSSGLTKAENVSYKDMINEVERDCLFSTRTVVPWHMLSKSQQCLYNSFVEPNKLPTRPIHVHPPQPADPLAASVKKIIHQV